MVIHDICRGYRLSLKKKKKLLDKINSEVGIVEFYEDFMLISIIEKTQRSIQFLRNQLKNRECWGEDDH